MKPPLISKAPPPADAYIGGGTAEWHAYLPSHPVPTLDYNELAPVQLSYVLTRCDTNKQTWEFCQIPRRRRGHLKEKMLHELGTILEDVCAANDDNAPIGVAQDFHGSHLLITRAFLGLCRKAFLSDIPWFKDATFVSMCEIPGFVYQVLKWKKEQYVFCCGDTAHLQKHWADQVRSGIRWIKVAGAWVSIICGCPGGFLAKQQSGIPYSNHSNNSNFIKLFDIF